MKSKFNPNREDKSCVQNIAQYNKNFDAIFRKTEGKPKKLSLKFLRKIRNFMEERS